MGLLVLWERCPCRANVANKPRSFGSRLARLVIRTGRPVAPVTGSYAFSGLGGAAILTAAVAGYSSNGTVRTARQTVST